MTTKGTQQEFEDLLEYLRQTRGFDFTGYKPASLTRRIEKRMSAISMNSYVDYIDYLEVYPNEFTQLFNDILINVTSFFRDPAAWEYLAAEVLPDILSQKSALDPIRVWSTGCASGEEAYTIAMLLAEAIGEERSSEKVKIYATDVDEEALNKARSATYTEKEVEGIPSRLLEKYFTKFSNAYSFNKELRRSIIFGRNDMIQDAPISRVDLLICRNTLMYFNAETQSKVLARFHFALNNNGYLFLGKAEALLSHTNTFSPVDVKQHIFNKVSKNNLRGRAMLMAQSGSDEGALTVYSQVRLRDAAFETSPIPQLVIDTNNIIVFANKQLLSLFGLLPRDLGRPFQDLEMSYNPVELRAAVQRAYLERSLVTIRDVEWFTPLGAARTYEVNIQPLTENGSGTLIGACISFLDISQQKLLQRQLEHSNQNLETAFEELQSSNEELETTNEELQSTIEELETTNEELQSTNEELETMNEELQSTNEELQTINDELHQRTDDLNQLNYFLDSVLASMSAVVVIIDNNMRVETWNRHAEELWGLRKEETLGKNFFSLDFGLPLDGLVRPFRETLNGDNHQPEIFLQAVNRRGKPVTCQVRLIPLQYKDADVRGVIAIMECSESDPAKKRAGGR